MVFSVLTVSDRCSRGEADDKSGPLLCSLLEKTGSIREYKIVPDELQDIADALIRMCDETDCDVVFTTGGTGFSPRNSRYQRGDKIRKSENNPQGNAFKSRFGNKRENADNKSSRLSEGREGVS